MTTGINNIVNPTADGTDNINTVKIAFQRILDAALHTKYAIYNCINIQTQRFYREKDSIKETVRKVIELMKSGIDNIAIGGTNIDMVKAFQIILDAALPPMYTTH